MNGGSLLFMRVWRNRQTQGTLAIRGLKLRLINTYVCKDGRTRAYIEDEDGVKKSISYPRILMAEILGRPLDPEEQVHHKDGNPLNNSPDNLEVVPFREHQKRHSKYHDKYMICPVCNKEFLWKAKQQRFFNSNSSRRKGDVPFCSRRCAGIFGKREQIVRNSNAECK